jgi:hypothetical protein
MVRGLILALTVAAAVAPQCGPGSTTPGTLLQNFQTITVNAGPSGDYFNGAFTSVTICVPGQSSCQTISGVLIDTGSSGVRVLSSALTLPLPQQNDASGSPVVECAQFLDGFTWGPVQTADVKLGGEQANAVPIQVIGSPAFPTVPIACSNTGDAKNTLSTLGANGILGIASFKQDCGPACVSVGASNPGFYYACPSSGCRQTAVSLQNQAQNPVSLFSANNNGTVIQLPSVAPGGVASTSGMLIFGIGTQANNALGPARVLTLDASGDFSTNYGGILYQSTYVDSGTNGIFFLDSRTTGLPICRTSADFYCPTTAQSQSATNRGLNGVMSAVTFSVGNVDALSARIAASSEAAGPNPGGFAWGMPFFFGRSVFTAIEGQPTSGGTGPYVAY